MSILGQSVPLQRVSPPVWHLHGERDILHIRTRKLHVDVIGIPGRVFDGLHVHEGKNAESCGACCRIVDVQLVVGSIGPKHADGVDDQTWAEVREQLAC